MAGIKHATKKRFAKTTTRKSTIQSGISAEYTDYRKKLESVSASVKSLIKEIRATRDVWLAVAKHQKDFAEALVASLPSDGVVRSHAKEVETTVRQLQRLIVEDEGASAPHRKITAVLEGYLQLIQTVATDYSVVETSYTEVLRYQKKVDKLSKKGAKKEVTLSRNMEKLNTARADYDQKLAHTTTRQKSAYDKHEAVFQCAHHAFWIAHDKYAQTVNEATKSIRWESVAVREHLVNIDVSNTPKLTAIPRVQMLMPPAEATDLGSVPLLEDAVTPVNKPGQAVTTEVVTSTSAPLYTRNAPPPIQISQPSSQAIQPIVQQPIEVTPAVQQPVVLQSIGQTSGHLPQTSVHMTLPSGQLPPPPPGYTYTTQQPPVVHLTPEKPSVSVSLPPEQGPETYGPAVPTQQPQMPQVIHLQPAPASGRAPVGV